MNKSKSKCHPEKVNFVGAAFNSPEILRKLADYLEKSAERRPNANR